MPSGRSGNVACWNVSHTCFETDRRFVSCLPKQPQNQDGNHHYAEQNTEQDQCRQELANSVENRGTKS
jgi:hypothetical protein